MVPMFRSLSRLALVFATLLLIVPDTTSAHDSWIMKGGHRNAAGEWCCGEGDCFMIPAEQVTTTGDGYLIFGAERIPYTETQPSIDGAFWRCKRPDGSRRCFFAPPPAT
jgi:hypothetical protein